ADRTRGRRDEVREIAKRAELAVPALAGDQLGEWRLAGHERLATPCDRVPRPGCGGIEGASALVACEQHTALHEQPTPRGDPARRLRLDRRCLNVASRGAHERNGRASTERISTERVATERFSRGLQPTRASPRGARTRESGGLGGCASCPPSITD